MQLLKLRSIIGAALALLALFGLAGCSVLRIGYSQAPNLAYWWVDGYVDLNDAQTPPLREAIDRWFEWHRRNEMPRYATLLSRAQRDVMDPGLSADAMCGWREQVQQRLDAGLAEAAPALATLVLSLTPQQIRHVERKLARNGDKLKQDFAQADPRERAKASFERTLERFENLYGRLDDAQRARLAELLATSPFDAERWLAERDQRNRDLLAMLASVSAAAHSGDAAAAHARAQAAVRSLAASAWRSPRPDYRAYQERLIRANCVLAATMHGAATLAQRQHARDKLRGWEDDVRLIVAAGRGGAGDDDALPGNVVR